MSGYWNEPEKTAETIRGGWLYSGDMAKVVVDISMSLDGFVAGLSTK